MLRGYQVLVVGAGIIGAACAYRLAERGLRVGVIERAPAPAMGSTGRSAAGVRVQFTEAINILLSWHSILEYRGMPEAAYRPIGYLFLVPESRWLTHMAGVGLQRSLGVPVEVWGLEEARRRVEFRPQASGLEPVRGATFGPADGVVDPHGICLGYLQRARRLGAEVHTGVELLSARRAEGVWEVQTSGGMLYAEFILNAAGAWAGEVGRRAGLSIPVHPARRMVFCTAPGPLWDHPLTVDLHSGFWFRPEGSRLIFGRSNPADVGFREGMDWGWLEPTLEVGLARFPWLERLQLDQRASWWGYYEVTPDHNPILGWMPGVEGWVNACGFSGHGVQQAAMVGRLMAEEIADGRAHSLNIDPLRYERWSEGRGFSEGNIV
ncbi:MAG: FAD-binding oxidoreductase [Meiothermus sp.]|uniref:NAD(P)/FAD-dependent oxidoreductase n=1 Tax=Meiothermus sp. TaxID=1955249 RepID=UPI0025D8B642|nr:FAD-dependent oxidoreductase [Meiothermus sp.]MCS7057500.1 FAD-binding oxidoreductase [Meiothermus sp.]MCS7194932.1 FAD-binding oxidoreductase [Meiothermus sp.]MCX7739578.1 FAD-binding oxidoreductase [Meiothermus sp.]MDW8090853.1 FAD-dependent oxidoreductase [Meiothermus sp.]MDW8482451.1 FAD-dependent oxidoreductase [Meiothermus sp.]